VIGMDIRVSSPPCARRGVQQGQAEYGGIVLVASGPQRPEAVFPDRALYSPAFSHLLIVHKPLSLSLSHTHTHKHTHTLSLSLALSLSLSLSLTHSLTHSLSLARSQDSPSPTHSCESELFRQPG